MFITVVTAKNGWQVYLLNEEGHDMKAKYKHWIGQLGIQKQSCKY